jgi:hypothetical protein
MHIKISFQIPRSLTYFQAEVGQRTFAKAIPTI